MKANWIKLEPNTSCLLQILKNSRSLKQINVHQTGTFKADCSSNDTRNQSIDKYGNEVREFVIGHSNQARYQSPGSFDPSSTGSNRISTMDNKENRTIHNIIVEENRFGDKSNLPINTRNEGKFVEFKIDKNENLPQPVLHHVTHRLSSLLKSHI